MRICCFALVLGLFGTALAQSHSNAISAADVRGAEALIGLDFSDAKIELLRPGLGKQREHYEVMRQWPLSNGVPPALQFNPLPVGYRLETQRKKFRATPLPRIKLPDNPDALAFYSISELAALLKSRQITSVQLTEFYLERLKRIGPQLECVVTLTEDLALAQARRADREIAAGHWRGPLHGIPYGAKDLFATKGIATTWGAAPYTNQVFDFDATVIQRLEAAGAVLVAKTTLGELAMGETWFGGMTRNPWNRQQGSSGSSAGSAAGTAAGLFAFGLGTETYGSILSPATRCGVTGLRPTYGRVSRAGAMTLSWSMDKIGPLCRTAEDCALVFQAIQGPDGEDPTVLDVPFNYDARLDVTKLRVGYLQTVFETKTGDGRKNDEATLATLRQLGVRLQPVTFPEYPLSNISFLLSTEAAAAFDELTLSGQDDWLKQQTAGDWPNTFRQRRFVPAVEYLRAQRIRWLLIQDMAKAFAPFDVILAPSGAGMTVLLGNLTGHPCVVVPNGFSAAGAPTSIYFLGKLYGEAELLALAKRYQDATDHHRKHPTL
ncbi:MAG TPA: amidase [Verrucomicrobiota bacterium]|jgi:Asp-tRNA(Asn)/Glu-tRNA(Gln) amidotransferase A subunit family amidase|nr:amidase [Verrucomicrobiota bacterium]OQB93670.1 MAG: Glutamyl-tRNA(Gln) amidotransferase subunit A [Verrucomicrobia bacterium ADurb.Bin118]HPY32132.1 amidase [Verrucomicrobiota bacterium]HQB15234.1 amidase [Verrucomicrobiota bacterium]